MSSTLMFGVPRKGEIEQVKEYPNSWCSAPLIWDYMAKKYLTCNWLQTGGYWEKVWHMKLEYFERVCLELTFDKIIVKKERVDEVSKCLVKMHKLTNKKGLAFNHLKSIADDMKKHKSKYIGFCFIWTTVDDSGWDSERFELDEDGNKNYLLWDISKDKGHQFLICG